MPKLNVQQTNQNIIQAFKNALAIGNLKGIIASDGRHNFSTAGSNRNLLDNSFFTAGNVVNQRGVATIPHTQYGIDRWKGELGSATITVTNEGLAYQGTSADLYQPMESALRTFLNGKTLTASVLKNDGTIESGSAAFTNGAKIQFIYNSETGADVFISAAGNFNLRYLNRTSATTVVAAKLELGSVSTLANDAPPEYATELRKCQYYYREFVAGGTSSIGLAWAYSATGASVLNFFGFGNNMRTKPTAAYSGGFNLQTQSGTSLAVTEVRLSTDVTTSVANVNFIVASGLTANQPCRVTANAGAKITFSADL